MIDLPYGFRVRLPCPFQEAVRRVSDSLVEHGLQILTRVDVHEDLQRALGLDVHGYVHLEVYHPTLAARALTADREAGLLLPGSVIVYEDGPGTTGVAAAAPLLMAVERGHNPALTDVARENRRAPQARARRAGGRAVPGPHERRPYG